MKAYPLLCFLLLAALNTGCSFFVYAGRNMYESPTKAIDYCQELKQFVAWAEESWKQIQAADPTHYSDDYKSGFIDGYADYIDRGGLGEPPAAPPDRYQYYRRYATPEGVAAIQDYFAGFRHGAAAARASGQRELIVLPLSLPPRRTGDYGPRSTRPPVGPQAPQPPRPPGAVEEAPPPRREPEEIPLPKKLPPAAVQPPAPAPAAVGTLIQLDDADL
jgi:hypothetical protein